MLTKTRKSLPVTGYVAPHIKRQMEELAANNRRKNISCQVEEALAMYLPTLGINFNQPIQGAHGKRKATA